jgi:hypothetical protein
METLNISQLAQDVFDEKESPLKAYGIAKQYMKQATEALKAIEEAAIEEASKYEKTFEAEGFKFEQRNGSKRFDYSNIKEIQEAKEAVKELEKKHRAAYNYFQVNLTSSTEDGEVLELPTVNMGKDVLIVKEI